MIVRPAPPLAPAQTWWLLATGLAAFLPLTPHVPLWLSGVVATVLCWRAALAWGRRPLPGRWMPILASVAGAAGVLLEYRTLFGQQAGVALLLLFLALKQMEARIPRDGLVVVLLAYFLTLTQFFEDQSILVGLVSFGSVLVATAALASLTDAPASVTGLLRLSATLLLQALPFMLILFLLFPRVSGPLWGLPQDAYRGLTGLSDSMTPGTISNLSQSGAIAFRVRFDGPVPPKQQMYWRGPVLPHLRERTWTIDVALPASQGYAARPDSPAYRYAITLEPHNRPWLFALELPDGLPAGLAAPSFATGDFQLLSRRSIRERIRYELVSRTEVDFLPASPPQLAAALALPAGSNPRTQALGAAWAQDGGSDATRVQRGIDFMREQRLGYTLQPPLTGIHTADEFLFDSRRGFCEHFSSAFVVLMRAAGVPARVVTGYQGGEHNPVDDTWVIRQSDAHAWAEVWLAERGWVRVDPTAASHPARIEQNLAAAVPVGDPLPLLARQGFIWLREARFRWWALNNVWNQWVLGYNPQRQRELLERLGMYSPDWRKMSAALAILSGVALLGLALWLLRQRPGRDAAERAWHRFSRRLARRGLARHAWEGPRDYATRLAYALPTRATEIRHIAELYCAARYAGIATALPELERRIAVFKT